MTEDIGYESGPSHFEAMIRDSQDATVKLSQVMRVIVDAIDKASCLRANTHSDILAVGLSHECVALSELLVSLYRKFGAQKDA